MFLDNIGEITAQDVKTGFDVSSYRNVLGILQSFDDIKNRYGSMLIALRNNFATYFISVPYKYSVSDGYRLVNFATRGYAIKKIGDLQYKTPLIYLDRLINQAQIRNSIGYFDIGDMVRVARTLEWELNRLRLPLPHNFRQLLDKIQNVSINIPRVSSYDCSSDIAETCIKGNTKDYVKLAVALESYPQLTVAINTIRNSLRKQIDSAALAPAVSEETIRSEQEALITREKAAQEADERSLIILAEKKAALEKEFNEAENIKNELAEIREQLSGELEALKLAKSDAQTESEELELEKAITVTIGDINKNAKLFIDKNRSIQTAINSSKTVNKEIDKVINKDKKSGIMPILLTVVAGVFLT